MRRKFFFTGFLICLLLSVSPVIALSYSGSSLLDLTSLTFKGINFPLTQDVLDSGGGLSLFAQDGVARIDQYAEPFIGPSIQFNESNSDTWKGDQIVTNVPMVGTATTTFDSTQLATSINLISRGLALGSILRQRTIFAQEASYLTVSIQYSLAQSGVPSSLTGFSGSSFANMYLGSSPPSHTLDFCPFGDGSQNGTLCLTRWFNANESALFALIGGTNASKTVFMPDMP